MFCLVAVDYPAHRRQSGAAAPLCAVTDELLDSLCGVHFPCIDVAAAINTHLMQVVKFAGHPSAASQPAQLLEVISIQDVDCHVGVVANIKAALRLVFGEIDGYGSSDYIRVFADRLLREETAFAGYARWIAARLAQRGIVFVKHLNPVVPPVTDINLPVIGDLYAVHRVPEECRFLITLGVVRDPRTSSICSRVVDWIVPVSAEMADIFTRRRIHDQNAAVPISVSNV